MRAFVRSAASLFVAGLFLSLAWVGPANAVDGPVTLRVPVELKKMIAVGVRVFCSVWADQPGQGDYLGVTYRMFPIVNGEFNQVVEVVVNPSSGKNFVGAKFYRCGFDLKENEKAIYHFPPVQGPPAEDLWKIAKPGEFFRSEVTGQLSGVAFGGGPKNLQVK